MIEMDTDSSYFALSQDYDKIEEFVRDRPDYQENKKFYESKLKKWIVLDKKKQKRVPGLFKLEKSGHKIIALGSKSYHLVSFHGSKTAQKGKGNTTKNDPRAQKERQELIGTNSTKAEKSGCN